MGASVRFSCAGHQMFLTSGRLVLALGLFQMCAALALFEEGRNLSELVNSASSAEDSEIRHRIPTDHHVFRRHVIATDTRRLLQNELKKIPKHGTLPLLLKRQTSISPWSTLYYQEYVHQPRSTIPFTQSSPYSAPTAPAAAFQLYDPVPLAGVHRHASGHMMTVIKTAGAPSVQRTDPKDFYTNVNRTYEDTKKIAVEAQPTSSPPTKVPSKKDQELEDINLAYDHFVRMRESGRCHLPSAEVVCVKELYPSATKEYVPRCTLLHRCGDKSGCCDKAEFRCVPKAIQEIALSFYTILNPSPTEANVASSVEKLLFENHTECECVNQLSQPSPVETFTIATTSTTTSTAPPDEELQKDRRSTEAINHFSRSLCRKCPPPFVTREHERGRCSCDCFDKQKPCLKIKRGRLPLEEHWRRCVEQKDCHTPSCEYGSFDDTIGRCPERPNGHKGRKQHVLATWEERD